MQIFESYIAGSLFDEVYDSKKNVRECWKDIVKNIEDSGLELLKEKQSEIDWHLENNGVTYNIYDDHNGPSTRSWSLDPIPFVIEEREWATITKGCNKEQNFSI